MTATRQVTISCDALGCTAEVTGIKGQRGVASSATEVREQARVKGWAFVTGARDLCPDHAPNWWRQDGPR